MKSVFKSSNRVKYIGERMFKKTKYSVNKYIQILFYVLIAIIFVGFFCAESLLPSELEQEIVTENLKYEGDVIWEKPDGSREKITLPGEYNVKKGQVMVLTTILPDDYSENTIAIRGSQQNVRLYIDGELRTEYDTKDSRPFGSESASRYVFCKTSNEDAGKELRIELQSNSQRYSGVVNEIFSGDKMEIWTYIYNIYGKETVSALFILFAGIVTIVFSVALSIAYKSKINLQYLGWCMVLGAVWLLGESKFRQLFAPNVSVLASLCFIVVMLCPVPILLYVDSVQHGRYRKFYAIIQCTAILNLLISSVLQFAEIVDYLNTLIISHIIMGSAFFAVFLTCFIDYRKGRIKEYLLIIIGLMVGMLGAVIESISVYFVVMTSGLFLGIGLMLLLFFAIIKNIQDIRALENKRNKEQLENRRKQTEAMSLQMIQTLSTTIEAKDEYTQGHSYRVAEYSALIARELGWDEKDIENLKNAARLHDVGKIGIPDTILNKPTKLLDAEYEIIKKHTTIGADILKNITLIKHVEEVARYHHEQYDGSGYPDGLSGEMIPIHARIVAVADSYDAMNSKRIYRNPLSKETIRKEINRKKGIQFDPKVADAFLKLFDENCLDIDETIDNTFVSDETSEMETNGTAEAGKFISDIVDTMNNRKDTEQIDYLTGLPMRNLGEKQIAQNMQDNEGCLVFIDMDNLKKINDIYGHKSGDRVLKLLGEIISKCTENAISCRLGGDEFLFFLPNVTKDDVLKIVGNIFESFNEKKENDIEIRAASLSGGMCMSIKGDSFAECYAKADKALYYVKQNGKNGYSFYHQIQQDNGQRKKTGEDLKQVVKALRQSGHYSGALGLDNREFSKIYEYMANLGERYKHTCHLVMITMDADAGNTMFIEKIEQALGCMETAIRSNIRNVDICTRYSSMQYLLILFEVGTDNISQVIKRIFNQYYKLYSENDFQPHYEYMPMMEKE